MSHQDPALETVLAPWRRLALESGIEPATVDMHSGQLQHEAEKLMRSGLDADEAALIAMRRLGTDNDTMLEAARGLAARLLASRDTTQPGSTTGRSLLFALGAAIAAGLSVKAPSLLGTPMGNSNDGFYLRNLPLLVLPWLLVLLAWLRRPSRPVLAFTAGCAGAVAVFANAYPLASGGSSEVLTALHTPVLLWFLGLPLASAGAWRALARRMDYVRFSGDWAITYVLFALGGGVLVGLTVAVFGAIGIDAEPFITQWVLPCGAAGAVLVSAWLTLGERNPVRGIAPMLAAVFTPLFAIVLVALFIGFVASGRALDAERDALIVFDVLLLVVLALVLYGLSAPPRPSGSGWLERMQLLLVVGALAVDIFVLLNMGIRLAEMGSTPNRVAGLGLNLLLFVNLARTALLRWRSDSAAVADWQMRYLPAFAAWAAVVVVVFPPVFDFR